MGTLEQDVATFLESLGKARALRNGELGCERCQAQLSSMSIGAIGAIQPAASDGVICSCREPACVWHVVDRIERLSPCPLTMRSHVACRSASRIAIALAGIPGLPLDSWSPDAEVVIAAGLAAVALGLANLALRPAEHSLWDRRGTRRREMIEAQLQEHEARRREQRGSDLAAELQAARRAVLAETQKDLIHRIGTVSIQERAPDAWRDNGGVTVVIPDSEDPGEVLSNLTIAYLRKALLVDARRHVPEDIMWAADFKVAAAMLEARPHTAAAVPALLDKESLGCVGAPQRKRRCDQTDTLDATGWLLRIVLPLFKRTGDALGRGSVTPEALHEFEKVFDWLHARARAKDRSVQLIYDEGGFRVGIVLVGNKDVIARAGFFPYVNRAVENMYTLDLDVVFIVAFGRTTASKARKEVLDDLIRRPRVEEATPCNFHLRRDLRRRANVQYTRAFIGALWMRPPRYVEMSGRVDDPDPAWLPMLDHRLRMLPTGRRGA